MDYMNLQDFELCLECITEGAYKYNEDNVLIFYSCVGEPSKECYRIKQMRDKDRGHF